MFEKPVVLASGLSGLVGSKLAEIGADRFEFISLDISHPTDPVDITKLDSVQRIFAKHSNAVGVIHLAAYTDVTGAWKQTDDTSGIAYQVNVVGSENIARAAAELDLPVACVSTAYVFDGEKAGLYTETDQPNPIEWYGKTKLLSEEIVQQHAKNWSIFRIDQPFRLDSFTKQDIAHRILAGLEAGTLYPQFVDHFFGPTVIEDFVEILLWAIETKPQGVFHASSGEQWSDFAFASLLAEKMGKKEQVKQGSLTEYLKTSERPYQKNTAMSVEKLSKIYTKKRLKVTEAVQLLR